MTEGTFIEQLADAASRLVGEFNGPTVDKKTFNWNERSVALTKKAGLLIDEPGKEDQIENPVVWAVRLVATAYNRPLDIERLIVLKKAWEYYEEASRRAPTVPVSLPSSALPSNYDQDADRSLDV